MAASCLVDAPAPKGKKRHRAQDDPFSNGVVGDEGATAFVFSAVLDGHGNKAEHVPWRRLVAASFPVETLEEAMVDAEAAMGKAIGALDGAYREWLAKNPDHWPSEEEQQTTTTRKRKWSLSSGAVLILCVSHVPSGTFRLTWLGDCEGVVVDSAGGVVYETSPHEGSLHSHGYKLGVKRALGNFLRCNDSGTESGKLPGISLEPGVSPQQRWGQAKRVYLFSDGWSNLFRDKGKKISAIMDDDPEQERSAAVKVLEERRARPAHCFDDVTLVRVQPPTVAEKKRKHRTESEGVCPPRKEQRVSIVLATP